jgi:hypothetical protein
VIGAPLFTGGGLLGVLSMTRRAETGDFERRI